MLRRVTCRTPSDAIFAAVLARNEHSSRQVKPFSHCQRIAVHVFLSQANRRGKFHLYKFEHFTYFEELSFPWPVQSDKVSSADISFHRSTSRQRECLLFTHELSPMDCSFEPGQTQIVEFLGSGKSVSVLLGRIVWDMKDTRMTSQACHVLSSLHISAPVVLLFYVLLVSGSCGVSSNPFAGLPLVVGYPSTSRMLLSISEFAPLWRLRV